MLSQFKTIGNDLFRRGLVSSHSGNMSIRLGGDRMVITRRGSQLGNLEEQDLIETGIEKNDRNSPLASVELPVHRAIYKNTSAKAIIHAHPPHAIALSMTEEEISPSNVDIMAEIGPVPVIGQNMDAGPGSLAEEVAQTLKDHRIALVSGHGSFATGQLFEEAYKYTAFLEESCQVLWLVKTLKGRQA